jgi:hypothetical protein
MTPPNQSMKSRRSVNHLAPCILAISLLSVAIAEADQNFAGFRHIDASGEPPGTAQTAPDWGPVQTDKASIANLSPVLLSFFNNGPVFGPPGTVVGDFWQNTQLTGDWGGFRTSLAEHGIFFDLYSTARSRVTVSLTRTVLWLLSLGIFDKAYAKATAGSSDEHTYIAPDLFTAETPLGTYQGMTDQIVMPRTPGAFRTVLVPRGSSKPEWLTTK